MIRNLTNKSIRSTVIISKLSSRHASQLKINVNSNKISYITAFGLAVSCVAIYSCNNVSYSEPATFDIVKLKSELADLIDADSEKRNDGTSIGPTLVRLSWHASGTYSLEDKTGGSNGATMRFNPEASWGANAGLKLARDFLEPLKKKYNISYADLYTLSGVVALENMGGPAIQWRHGRKDSSKPTTVPDGRLPAADKGNVLSTISHVRKVFNRMGFNDKEIVALLGAHALGRCHTDRSGYSGPWTRAETTMSNEYYRLLLEETWTVKDWKGPKQYENKGGDLMMLPADLALIEDLKFKKYVEMYAKDEELFFKDFSQAFSKLLELGVEF